MKTVGDIITEVALKRRVAKGVKTTSCSEDQIECAGCQANLPMWSNAVELGQMQELALHVVQLPQWCTLPNDLHQGSGELMFPHASTSAHPSQGHWSSLSPHPDRKQSQLPNLASFSSNRSILCRHLSDLAILSRLGSPLASLTHAL